MTKISIDQKECIGCNLCASCAPDVFKNNEEDFKAQVNENGNFTDSAQIELSAGQLKQVEEAVSGCPAQAIKLSE